MQSVPITTKVEFEPRSGIKHQSINQWADLIGGRC
jgi:hypothetical protein